MSCNYTSSKIIWWGGEVKHYLTIKSGVIVGGILWTGENHRQMFDFLTDYKLKDDSMETIGYSYYIDSSTDTPVKLMLRTKSGSVEVLIGDYVLHPLYTDEYYTVSPEELAEYYRVLDRLPKILEQYYK